MRKTKIVCTLGPATDNEQILRDMILAGMSVARFNFSHGTHEEHKKRIELLKHVREEMGVPVAAMLDTKGPEVRIGIFENGKVELHTGQTFMLYADERLGDDNGVSISYPNLYKDLWNGARILLDDGLIEMSVVEIRGRDIVCIVKNGGVVSNRKGVNIPNSQLSLPFISDQDREDICFGIENDFDYIAASFVQNADNVLQMRKILDEFNCNTINIISKIENLQGVKNIDEIIRVSDGIMVARGDMGVEVPMEEVPVIQKVIIKKVYNAGKRVITATQMLESMIKNPRPTRAEVNDIANAIYDGTSAVMLSGETATGLYPVESVKTMATIAERTERDIDYAGRFRNRKNNISPDITNAISHATCMTAMDLGAAAIISVTKSGGTARMVSKYRPTCPIIACTTDEHVCRQLSMSWGVTPLKIEEKDNSDELCSCAVDAAEAHGFVKPGEIVAITAGVPMGISGTTNMIKVQVVGHILAKGQGITQKSATGKICVCLTAEDAKENFQEGCILVAEQTTNDFLPYIKHAAGIVTELGGANSHAAIVGLSLDIPVIVGAQNATKLLKAGTLVNIDARQGTVSSL